MCALLAMGCKKVEVNFTFSPAEPKAGESVSFSNQSSAGEKWTWTFGDNSTSLIKNPSKIYKKPGTYLVTLMVDSAKYNTCSHSITVYDTVPTFVASTDTIYYHHDITFTANIYNPFGYKLSYQWTLPDDCVLYSGSLTDNSIVVYFTNPNTTETVQLDIKQGDTQYPTITKTFAIQDFQAPAIVMKSGTDIYRQRIINERLDSVRSSFLSEDELLLSTTTDTCVTFNGVEFYASKMSDIFPDYEVQRLQIDAMAQKWYVVTSEGLFVANFTGLDLKLIDADATGALCVDAYRNQLYWASTDGLKAMPLVKSKNNQFSTQSILYNHLSAIDRIVVNNDPL